MPKYKLDPVDKGHSFVENELDKTQDTPLKETFHGDCWSQQKHQLEAPRRKSKKVIIACPLGLSSPPSLGVMLL